MKFVKGFGMFWYDFIIGDDWKIAAAVVLALALAAVAMLTGLLSGAAQVLTAALAIVVFFVASVIIDVRNS